MGISLFFIVFGLIWIVETFYTRNLFRLIPALKQMNLLVIQLFLIIIGCIPLVIGLLSWMGIIQNALEYTPVSNYTLGLTLILLGLSSIMFSRAYAKLMIRKSKNKAFTDALGEAGLSALSIGFSVCLITFGIINLLGI
jgi:uncharacterized membrane protein